MLRIIITLALNNFNIWSNNLYKTKLILVLAEFLHKNNETKANKHHNIMSHLFSDLYYKHNKSKYFYSFSMKQPAPQLPMHHVKNIVIPSIIISTFSSRTENGTFSGLHSTSNSSIRDLLSLRTRLTTSLSTNHNRVTKNLYGFKKSI